MQFENVFNPNPILDSLTITAGSTTGITKTTDDLLITCASEKTLLLDTPVWDDLPPTPIITSHLGSSAPTLATFVSDIEQYTFDATNDYVYGSTEITHKWEEGTIMYPHIHWATNGSEGSETGVKWQLKFVIGDATEVFSSQITLAVDTTIPAGTTDRTHFVSDFVPTINAANTKIGAYICWRLERIASAKAAPAADPFAIAVGFHVRMDTMGSRTRSAK